MLNIMKNDPPTLEPHPEWTQSLKDFLSDCLQKDPERRLSANQLLTKYSQTLWSKSKDGRYILEQLKVSELGHHLTYPPESISSQKQGIQLQKFPSEKISVKTATSVDADSQESSSQNANLFSDKGPVSKNLITWNFDLGDDEG